MEEYRTMAQLLEAPNEGYEDAIIVPEITADNFELKYWFLPYHVKTNFFRHDQRRPSMLTSIFHKSLLNDEVPERIPRLTVNQPPAYQAPTYQAPAPQTQGVLKTDFESYVKANDAVMQNMQSQISNITDLLTKIANSNAASTSGSGSLPSNIVANPKGELKANQHIRSVPLMMDLKFHHRLLLFLRIDECLALADLDASINLMPLSVWKKLSLPELTPTCMTLELADRTISHPIGIAKDVYVKTGRALIDVCKGKLTLRVGKEAVTFNLDQTSRFSDIEIFLLEEVDAFLAIEDDPTSPEVDHSYYDPEGDILLLEAFLNDDPSLPPPFQGNYLPKIRKELKIYEAKNNKSSIDESLKVELKDLPPHLEYSFLEGDDKLPVIIAKDLSVEEKAALIKVLNRLETL
ncbi:hypothetical protein Tco_0652189 [Tanacetum coccineum]|uniref:Reverse transcriptase domain-containing protein n=1 Tax=Tanacetum coccineum TaxID=301880 RepID=A0ABQ4WX44_9ASTR